MAYAVCYNIILYRHYKRGLVGLDHRLSPNLSDASSGTSAVMRRSICRDMAMIVSEVGFGVGREDRLPE
jgi:hypothetical protein